MGLEIFKILIDIFHQNNFRIYMIGGTSRDYLLGKNFFDYDFISFPYYSFDNLETFYYVDPPYLITVGAYGKDYFCKWSEEYECQLLNKK